MKLNDIIALAKAGFGPAEVRELMSLEASEPETNTQAQPNPAEGAEEQQGAEPEKPKPQNEPESDSTGANDNKDLDALKEQIADLTAKLEAAQKINVTQVDFSAKNPAKTGEELAEEIARRFM